MITRPINNSQAPPPRKEHRLRILLYEPEASIREDLYEILRKEHNVVPIRTEFEHRHFFMPFDILILNPDEKNLTDLLHSIYSRFDEEKPWLIVTSENEELRFELKKLKTDRLFFIPKPYDLDLIEKTIDKIARWEAEKKEASKKPWKRFARFFR